MRNERTGPKTWTPRSVSVSSRGGSVSSSSCRTQYKVCEVGKTRRRN
jgi:hypothetical protein